VVGYLQQDIYLTLWVGVAGALVTVVAVVPPWPFFNQHPELWLRSQKGGTTTLDISIGGKKMQ
jgi:signal peptidase complex subunit 1